MTIRLAAPHDIPNIMELEARYFVGNLDQSEQVHGFISTLHSQEWFRWAVDCEGVHIAVSDDGTIEGFIAVTPPPTGAAKPSPIISAMLALTPALAFKGRPISQQRFAFRGPVLIDRSARGQGLYSAFNAVARQTYADRFDIGILFVSADNPLSLHTTTSKLGAEPLAVFDVVDKQYYFLAFAF